jgi:hypothetical protein
MQMEHLYGPKAGFLNLLKSMGNIIHPQWPYESSNLHHWLKKWGVIFLYVTVLNLIISLCYLQNKNKRAINTTVLSLMFISAKISNTKSEDDLLFWKLVAEINTRDNIVVLTVFSPLY